MAHNVSATIKSAQQGDEGIAPYGVERTATKPVGVDTHIDPPVPIHTTAPTYHTMATP